MQDHMGDSLGNLLASMNTAIDSIKKEDEAEEIASINRMAKEVSNKITSSLPGNVWYKGMPQTRVSKKPLTDALGEILPPRELAQIIADYAKKGRDWAVRLAATYTQTPETLNRIGGEVEGEPIRMDRLVVLARDLGVDLGEAIQEGEKQLKAAWEILPAVVEVAPADLAPSVSGEIVASEVQAPAPSDALEDTPATNTARG